eukprot:2084666-Alexandrium_andersonii.AAC.1
MSHACASMPTHARACMQTGTLAPTKTQERTSMRAHMDSPTPLLYGRFDAMAHSKRCADIRRAGVLSFTRHFVAPMLQKSRADWHDLG